MTDDWFKIIYKKIVGALLIDFSAAFDITDHNLSVMAFQPQIAISGIQNYLIELKEFSLKDASLMSNM